MNNNMILSEKEIENINGGGLGGVVAGAILGGAYTMTGAVIGGASTPNEIWKAYSAGALSGAAIGIYSPV